MDNKAKIEALAKASWDRDQRQKSIFDKYIMRFKPMPWKSANGRDSQDVLGYVRKGYMERAELELMLLEQNGFTVQLINEKDE